MNRILILVFCAVLLAAPSDARLWKPTPQQQAQDYLTINHSKGNDGRVVLTWLSSAGSLSPTMKDLMDKYVVISLAHTANSVGGAPPEWIDPVGIQVTDGSGTPLKEVTGADIPPSLVGLIAGAQAAAAQATQGKAKVHWMVFQAGAINACSNGRLAVTYAGETYTFDTPLPGCGKT